MSAQIAPPAENPARLVPRPRFRADIEGLRAVAVLLVVLYHAGVPGFGGGYIGVDVFFVLSGYLITWLLVHEAEETGTVDLVRFYARRARRLLPAVAVVLVATVAVGALVLAPFEQRDLAKSALATAAYLSNVFFARRATDYLGAAAEDNPLLHTWSLSVEEQFYVVWPVFVLFAFGALGWQRRAGRRPSRRRLVGWMAAVAVVSFAASVYLTGVRQPWAFFLSPLRAWEFAAGALGMLVAGGGAAGSRRLNPGRVGAAEGVLGWVGLAAIVAVGALYRADTLFPGWAAAVPVAATVLALRAGTARTETALARALAWRPLQELGRLSYSWYLWHWPVLVFGAALGLAETLPARLALVALSLGLAEASYRLVEDPVRHHPALAGRVRAGRSLALAVALTALGVGLSAAWWQAAEAWAQRPDQVRFTEAWADLAAVYGDECHADFYATAAEGCSYGVVDADTTVVLFGDSHAAQWFPAIERVAMARGWRLVSLTKSACPAVDVETFNPGLGRIYDECTMWREAAFEEISRLRPYLVVASSSSAYLLPSYEDRTPVRAWDTAWRGGAARVFQHLAGAADHVVYLEDSPRPNFDVTGCLARAAWQPWSGGAACQFQAKNLERDRAAQVEKEAASAGGVGYVAWADELCSGEPCETVRGSRPLYRDGDHLAASFVADLTPVVARRIDEAIR
ncbi:acyltransferase family protein [Rubrivirga sp. S365]|uniref:acyltransferase family protein n=1 Tax=Rubrivirga sp. S365 TaxID=3076080 RepID=UPI0028C8649D|nr:acyltransferase family protein [Rubrivirga sp. S365]MDT7855240.1 acyltransferase family protein [Rubrivirga sp. S365]